MTENRVKPISMQIGCLYVCVSMYTCCIARVVYTREGEKRKWETSNFQNEEKYRLANQLQHIEKLCIIGICVKGL